MAMVVASLNSIVANMFTVFVRVRMKVNLTERLPKHLRILSLTTTTDPPHTHLIRAQAGKLQGDTSDGAALSIKPNHPT